MPRRPRLEGPNALHHVVVQAASGGRIVEDDSDRLGLLGALWKVVSEHRWDCVAYCVLDTHAHLLLRTPEPNLGAGMKLLLGRYAFAHNRRHDLRGHLFGRRYWSRRVDEPHYLRCAALYVDLNPVAAGLCVRPVDFRWSSHRETVGAVPASGFLATEVLLRTLADDPELAVARYRALVDDAVARLGRRRAEDAWWMAVERAAADRRATLETG